MPFPSPKTYGGGLVRGENTLPWWFSSNAGFLLQLPVELFLINRVLKEDAGRWPQRPPQRCEVAPWDLRGKDCRALAHPVTGSGRRQLVLELCLTCVENPAWMVLGWIREEIQDPWGMFLLFRARSLSPSYVICTGWFLLSCKNGIDFRLYRWTEAVCHHFVPLLKLQFSKGKHKCNNICSTSLRSVTDTTCHVCPVDNRNHYYTKEEEKLCYMGKGTLILN